VYWAILEALTLSRKHKEALQKRGLNDEAIVRNQYRSLAVQGRSRIAAKLQEKFGDAILRVPGFVLKEGDKGRYLTIAGSAGLLIPCRDLEGQICALKVRRDEGDDANRYTYVSSSGYGGPGSGSPVHAPLGTPPKAARVRLTEGELKADVISALGELPTLSVPGVGNWRPSLESLHRLGCEVVRLTFDADAWEKEHVARSLAACVKALTEAGFTVELDRWDAADGKGLDDLLAAGKQCFTLTGEGVQAAILEALGETNGEEPGPGPFSRLHEVLNAGGAEALYRDRELLQAIADLRQADPPEYAAVVASIEKRVSIRALERALRAFQQPRDEAAYAPQYFVEAGSMCRTIQTRDGLLSVPLCNFDVRIKEDVVHDDGAEPRRAFLIEGTLVGNVTLPRIEVNAEDFADMSWVVALWGTRAVVYAGQGTRDHLRTAIQLLSGDVPCRTIYGHLGWREIGDRWHYLHCEGAVTADGHVEAPVEVPEVLGHFCLPAPPQGEQLCLAVRASLGLLHLGPAWIVYPLLATVYRAVLGGADFAVHLAGRTGCFKSEAAALVQQHFGAGMDARHLPGNWASTGNALEGLAFLAKDAVFVVDDFCPAGSSADVQRLHRDADRLMRGQGNHSGRHRMRPDAGLRPSRSPRGLIVSTGEDVPRGQSLRARMLVLEITPGDLGQPGNAAELTRCQDDACKGLYATSLAGFLRWIAPKYGNLRGDLRAGAAKLRQRLPAYGHARTPGLLAELYLGLQYFLDFAADCGAITPEELEAQLERGWQALKVAGAAQAEQAASGEPGRRFLQLLAAAMTSGRAHLADKNGNVPDCPERWGWRTEQGCQPRAIGERVGWLDEGEMYLDPDASFAAVKQLADDQGENFAISANTLRRRMNEQGLLSSRDNTRGKLTIRRSFQGERREVLHINWAELEASAGPELNAEGQEAPKEMVSTIEKSQAMGRKGRSATGAERPDTQNEEWGEV
jgi:hypothetical protein